MFANLTVASGVNVISAAAGNEQALESIEWQNGVFTHLLKEAAANAAAHNKFTIEDMAKYARDNAPRLTDGAQHPQIKTGFPIETEIFNQK